MLNTKWHNVNAIFQHVWACVHLQSWIWYVSIFSVCQSANKYCMAIVHTYRMWISYDKGPNHTSAEQNETCIAIETFHRQFLGTVFFFIIIFTMYHIFLIIIFFDMCMCLWMNGSSSTLCCAWASVGTSSVDVLQLQFVFGSVAFVGTIQVYSSYM